jgi:group I intron endonuclease
MNFSSIPEVAGVYKITNSESGLFYIGSSKNIKCRLVNHFRLLNKQTHKNTHLQRAFNKHGQDCFVVEVLEESKSLDKISILDLEQSYLDKIDDWRLCYNQTKFTRTFGKLPSDEELSQKNIGVINPKLNNGRVLSDEERLLLSTVQRKKGSGVAFKQGYWTATIKVFESKKLFWLGSFTTEQEAKQIRCLAEKVYWENDFSLMPKLEELKSKSRTKHSTTKTRSKNLITKGKTCSIFLTKNNTYWVRLSYKGEDKSFGRYDNLDKAHRIFYLLDEAYITQNQDLKDKVKKLVDATKIPYKTKSAKLV